MEAQDVLLHVTACCITQASLEHLLVTFAYAVVSATLMPCERFGSCVWELRVHEAGEDTWPTADICILTNAVTP